MGVRGTIRFLVLWHLRRLGRHVEIPLGRSVPGGLEPFGGSAYWAMTREVVDYVVDFADRERRFLSFFEHVDNSDELFFQTIVMNSSHEGRVAKDDLHYIDWSAGRSHPAILTREDFPALEQAPDLFARKFDGTVDVSVLDLIDERLLHR